MANYLIHSRLCVGLGHRKWGSPENIAVSEIFQAFRFMFVNVLFAVPRRGLIDIVARQLLHLEFKMRGRGRAMVYKIYPSDFSMEGIITPFAGYCQFGIPSKRLTDAYEKMKHEHGWGLLQKSRAVVDVAYKKFEQTMEKALKPKLTYEDELELGRKFLTSCIVPDKLDAFIRGGSEGRGGNW